MAKNEGKKFEDDLAKSLAGWCGGWSMRLKDDTSRFKNVFNIADFLVFKMPTLFLLELKSVKDDVIPFAKFAEKGKDRATGKAIQTYKRVDKLASAGIVDGVRAGFLIEFRGTGVVFYATAAQVKALIEGDGRRSITLAYARDNFMVVPREMLRTRYSYEIGKLLRRIEGHAATQ